jgi:hypothetical protein
VKRLEVLATLTLAALLAWGREAELIPVWAIWVMIISGFIAALLLRPGKTLLTVLTALVVGLLLLLLFSLLAPSA